MTPLKSFPWEGSAAFHPLLECHQSFVVPSGFLLINRFSVVNSWLKSLSCVIPNIPSIYMIPFLYNSEVDHCDTKYIIFLCSSSSCCLKKCYIWVLQHSITLSFPLLIQNLFSCRVFPEEVRFFQKIRNSCVRINQ